MKIALVTGASGIIGGACARMLAKKGYALALQYHRHPEKAQALFEDLSNETPVVMQAADTKGVQKHDYFNVLTQLLKK